MRVGATTPPPSLPALDVRIRRGLARFWREYTRMRTAIYFLIGLCLLVLIGSFVPQEFTSQQSKVDEFLAYHAHLNTLGTIIGLPLTSVFVSPLFFGLLASLYIALASCVLRRGRALLVRTIRGRPRTPQYWGEWGSWLFHASFFMLLIAVVFGKATGFDGIMTITEGSRLAEARANYDQLQEGLFFDGRHANYDVQLNSFKVPYLANGLPADFTSNVTVYDRSRAVLTKDIRVNDFLGYRDVDFYQQDFGFAPEIIVRNPAGQTVYDGNIQFFGNDKRVTTGILKVSAFGYTLPGGRGPVQLGARLALFPDAVLQTGLAPADSGSPFEVQYLPGGAAARNPVLQVQLFVGDLNLDGRAQNINALDTSRMQPYYAKAATFPLPLHASVPLQLPGAGGTPATFSVEFAGLKQYSLFHVKKDNGVPFVYSSFGMVMLGLMAKLYAKPLLEARARRRRTTAEARGSVWGAEPPAATDHQQKLPRGSMVTSPVLGSDAKQLGENGGTRTSGQRVRAASPAALEDAVVADKLPSGGG